MFVESFTSNDGFKLIVCLIVFIIFIFFLNRAFDLNDEEFWDGFASLD